jgi:Ca2+-binding RTX toxin-like protein
MLTDLVTKANAGSTIQELADSLATDVAFTSSFPVWMTASEFTQKVVDNVFAGSSVASADKTAAVDYIAGAITAGTFTKTSAVVALTAYLASADGVANTTYGSAAQAYQNKVAVAEYYTITKGQGGASAAERAAAIAGVTDAADAVATSKAAVDTTATKAADAAAAANAVKATMTTAAETLNGTTGDDTFAAVITGNGAAGTTILPGDVLNGGLGNDTLTISTAGSAGRQYTIAAIQTSSVETIAFNSFDTDTTTDGMVLDLTLMPGVTTVKVNSGSATGDIKVDNATAIHDLVVNNMAGDVNLNYPGTLTSALLGDQSQNINVSNQTAGTITINGIENMTVDSSTVKSTMADLVGDRLKTLTVTGDSNLTIAGAGVNFLTRASSTAIDGTVDASAFTGKLSMTFAADIHKITGGTGNDTFNMVGDMASTDIIDGGDGVDTITMTAATLTTQLSKVTNVETLKFNDIASTAVALDGSKVGDIATLSIDVNDNADSGGGGADTSNFAHTVTKLDGKTLVLRKTTEDAVDADDSDGNDVTITDTVDGVTDTLNITLANIGRNLHSATDYFGYDTLDVATYETINITANANATATNSFNEIDHLTATAGKTITVDGTGAFETVMAGTKVTSFDASALAGALTLTTGANKMDVKLGGKSSTVNFAATLDNNDKITGGAGIADTVNATMTGKTATTGALSMSGVEALTLTTSGANTLALADVSGLGLLTVTDNKQTITGYSLGTKLVMGVFTDAADTASEADVTATDATGAADNLIVGINTQAGAASTIIDASGIESLTMINERATTGTANLATVNLTTFEGTSVSLALGPQTGTAAVVTGGGFDLGQTHKNTTSVTSTAKAVVSTSFAKITSSDVSATFTGTGSGVQTVTGGAGADTFNIGATTTPIHVISGSGGKDITNLTVATGFVNPSLINTETLNVTVGAAVDPSLNAIFNSGVDNLNLLGGNELSTFTNHSTGLHTNVKTLDASGFAGNIVFEIGDDALDTTLTITGGSLATDKVSYNATAAGTEVPNLTGIEIVAVNQDAAGTLSLAASTGVSRVEVDVAASTTATITGITDETIRVTNAAANSVVQASLTDPTGLTDSVTFDLRDAATNISAGVNLQTTDIETVNIIATSAESVDLSQLAMTVVTGAEVVKLTTGITSTSPNGLTVSALSAQTTTVDASAGFGFVQTGRSATTSSTYTGSAGADTFIMMVPGDTITGGSVASHNKSANTDKNDTLDINYDSVLGGISIDLSSATNQILTMDGGGISGSVTGFENVALDGYGNAGAVVIAAAGGSTITGTGAIDRITGGSGADNITGGGGADVITGGGGADTMTGGAAVDAMTGGSGNDIYRFVATADLFTGQAIVDTITEAASGGTDEIRIANNGGSTFTIANNDRAVAKLANIEKITAEPSNQIITITFKADFDTDVPTLRTIDLSGDTTATSNNVVDLALVTGVYTVIGSTGVDTITGSIGVDALSGGLGTDSVVVKANGTGGAAALYLGGASIATGDMDVITVGATGENDTINLADVLATEAGYDAFVTVNNGAVLTAPTITAKGIGSAGTVSLFTGIYDAAANTFTSTAEGPTTNAVLIGTAAGDIGTAVTDGVVIVGDAGEMLAGDFGIANGIITH